MSWAVRIGQAAGPWRSLWGLRCCTAASETHKCIRMQPRWSAAATCTTPPAPQALASGRRYAAERPNKKAARKEEEEKKHTPLYASICSATVGRHGCGGVLWEDIGSARSTCRALACRHSVPVLGQGNTQLGRTARSTLDCRRAALTRGRSREVAGGAGAVGPEMRQQPRNRNRTTHCELFARVSV